MTTGAQVRGLFAGAGMAVLLTTSACAVGPAQGTHELGSAPPPTLHFPGDSNVYETVSELGVRAELVAIGQVTGVVSRELDDGGGAEPESGIPMVYYSFKVEEVLGGDTPKTPSIVLGWLDLERIQTTEVTPIQESARVVLFLDRVGRDDSPGIESVGELFVPLSGDNGVFDVVDEHATARSAAVRSLRPGGPGTDPGRKLRVPVSSIADVVTTNG